VEANLNIVLSLVSSPTGPLRTRSAPGKTTYHNHAQKAAGGRHSTFK